MYLNFKNYTGHHECLVAHYLQKLHALVKCWWGCAAATHKISIFFANTIAKHALFRRFLKHRSACLHFGSIVCVSSGLQMTFGTRQAPLCCCNKMKWPNSDHTYFSAAAARRPILGARCTQHTHNNNTQGIRLFYYFATRLMAQDHAITSLCTGHLLGARAERNNAMIYWPAMTHKITPYFVFIAACELFCVLPECSVADLAKRDFQLGGAHNSSEDPPPSRAAALNLLLMDCLLSLLRPVYGLWPS